MQLKIKENHTGTVVLKDGTKVNYGPIRVTRNTRKLIYYTDKGLREIYNPDATKEEKQKAEELKEQDEKMLMKSGHIAAILISGIKEFK